MSNGDQPPGFQTPWGPAVVDGSGPTEADGDQQCDEVRGWAGQPGRVGRLLVVSWLVMAGGLTMSPFLAYESYELTGFGAVHYNGWGQVKVRVFNQAPNFGVVFGPGPRYGVALVASAALLIVAAGWLWQRPSLTSAVIGSALAVVPVGLAAILNVVFRDLTVQLARSTGGGSAEYGSGLWILNLVAVLGLASPIFLAWSIRGRALDLEARQSNEPEATDPSEPEVDPDVPASE